MQQSSSYAKIYLNLLHWRIIMSNQAPEKGPYKHFERPSTSRRQSHSHRFVDDNKLDSSREKKKKNKNMTSLWSGLIIVAIILIAAFPLIFSQFGNHSKNLAEKEIPRSSKVSSDKKKSKVSKKVKKSSSVKSSQSKKSAVKSTPQRRVEQSHTSTTQNTQQTNTQNTNTQNNSYNQNNYQNSYASQNAGSEQTTSRHSGSSYTVKSGDTLSAIAAQNNMSVDQLRQLNGISGDSLSLGQELRLK